MSEFIKTVKEIVTFWKFMNGSAINKEQEKSFQDFQNKKFADVEKLKPNKVWSNDEFNELCNDNFLDSDFSIELWNFIHNEKIGLSIQRIDYRNVLFLTLDLDFTAEELLKEGKR